MLIISYTYSVTFNLHNMTVEVLLFTKQKINLHGIYNVIYNFNLKLRQKIVNRIRLRNNFLAVEHL